jgi:hypothetical protein
MHDGTGWQIIYVLPQVDISEIYRDSVPLQSFECLVYSGFVIGGVLGSFADKCIAISIKGNGKQRAM